MTNKCFEQTQNRERITGGRDAGKRNENVILAACQQNKIQIKNENPTEQADTSNATGRHQFLITYSFQSNILYIMKLRSGG